MADELNTQTTETELPSGGVPPVDEPVKTAGEPGAPGVDGAPAEGGEAKPPEMVPYERFKEVNEQAKVLRTLLLNREQAAPMGTQQVQAPAEPQQPAFVPPPEPNPKEYTDEDGYEDPVKKAIAYGEWASKKAIAEHEHKQGLAKVQESQNANVTRARQFVTKVSTKFPDFQENIRIAGNPYDHVAAAIIAMDDIEPEAAEKIAYHLAKNPLEMARLNDLSPLQASIAVGQLATKVSLPAAKPKMVSDAPNPTQPVKNTQTETQVDPAKMNARDYARTHPATANMPWLNK